MLYDYLKVFVRGIRNHGDEVRRSLKELGAKEIISCSSYYENDYAIYFINHEGLINSAQLNTELAKIIMDNYKEIKPVLWNDGNILCNNKTNDYAVFKEYSSDNLQSKFKPYFSTMSFNKETNELLISNDWHLASEKEIENFNKILCDTYHVSWDRYNKELITNDDSELTVSDEIDKFNKILLHNYGATFIL